jgi:hypothetical protein
MLVWITSLLGVSSFILLVFKCIIGIWFRKQASPLLNHNHVEEDNQWLIYIPIPWIRSSKQHSIYDPDNLTQYLNHLSQAFDFLHRNYLNYRNKNLARIPNYVLQKRLKPIIIEQKFQLAKELMVQDLKDSIEKFNLQILIQRQQIRELRRRLPPRLPFLYKSKYAPFYWILTDMDYVQMSPALRNVLIYNVSNTSFRNIYGIYDRSERFTLNEMDEKELDHMFFTSPHSTIPQRYKKLRSIWVEKQNLEHLIEQEQDSLFADYCFRLLKKRARLIVRRLRRLRRVELRNSIRERARCITELSMCNRLHLKRNVPQESLQI